MTHPRDTSHPRVLRDAGLLCALILCATAGLPAQQLFDVPATDFGQGATYLSLGHLDADEHLDAVFRDSHARIHVARGLGTGFFDAAHEVDGPLPFARLYLRDLDGDGFSDIVVTSLIESTLAIALSPGDGSIGPFSFVESGVDGVWDADFGDLDGNGTADIAFVSTLSESIGVMLGQGDGTLLAAPDVEIGKVAAHVAIGDVDGDGHLDLVVVHTGAYPDPDHSLHAAAGRGDGTFDASREIWNDALTGLAVIDVDGDGRDEILGHARSSGHFQIATLEADGSLTLRTQRPPGGHLGSLQRPVGGDWNEDGLTDLAVPTWRGTSILLQAPDGTFGDWRFMGLGDSTSNLAAADLDRDGSLDIVATVLAGMVATARGFGDGSFETFLSAPAGSIVRIAGIADINEDGREDVVIEADEKPLVPPMWSDDVTAVSVRLGGFGRRSGPTWTVPFTMGARGVHVMDVDADGHLDLLFRRQAAGASTGSLELMTGSGDGAFAEPAVVATGAPFGTVATGDLDGDGDVDLVAIRESAFPDTSASTFLQTAAGVFASGVSTALPQVVKTAVSVDMDGDGLSDLVTLGVTSSGLKVVIRPGLGDGGFGSPLVTLDVGSFESHILVADVTGDEHPDVVIASWPSSTTPAALASTSVYPGTGTGALGPATVISSAWWPSDVVAADFDRDGIQDLLVSSSYSNQAAALRPQIAAIRSLGGGAFAAPVLHSVPGRAAQIRPGELDGDGVLDLVLAISSSDLFSFQSLHSLFGADGPWTSLGSSLGGTNGLSDLEPEGSLQTGDELSLLVTGTPPFAAGVLVVGTTALDAPLAGGILVPSPDVLIPGFVTDASGSVLIRPLVDPTTPLPGDLLFQYWFPDAGAPSGFAATTALLGQRP